MIRLTDLLRELVQNMLPELSDEEKQRMGIPAGATGRGGKWYDPQGNYLGKTKDGSFQPAGHQGQATTGVQVPAAAPTTHHPPKSSLAKDDREYHGHDDDEEDVPFSAGDDWDDKEYHGRYDDEEDVPFSDGDDWDDKEYHGRYDDEEDVDFTDGIEDDDREYWPEDF